jgi:hypothetical protein
MYTPLEITFIKDFSYPDLKEYSISKGSVLYRTTLITDEQNLYSFHAFSFRHQVGPTISLNNNTLSVLFLRKIITITIPEIFVIAKEFEVLDTLLPQGKLFELSISFGTEDDDTKYINYFEMYDNNHAIDFTYGDLQRLIKYKHIIGW